MSTRATYEFNNPHMRGKYTVYIHHDGYPSGAASYFYSMALLDKGGLVERFIRANDGAILTPSHDAHGDTEYQYTVNGCNLTAILTGHRVNDGMCIFSGPLWEFINEHGKTISEWIDGGFQPFKVISLPYATNAVLNETLAKHQLVKEYGCLDHLRKWSKSLSANARSSANWRSQVDELRTITEAFPSLMTDEIASFIGEVVSGASS